MFRFSLELFKNKFEIDLKQIEKKQQQTHNFLRFNNNNNDNNNSNNEGMGACACLARESMMNTLD